MTSSSTKRCCEFWGFAIDRPERRLAVHWDGPPDAQDVVEQVLAYFNRNEALTAVSGSALSVLNPGDTPARPPVEGARHR